MTDTDTETTAPPTPPVAQSSSQTADPVKVATQAPHLTQGGTHVLMVNQTTDGVWDCPIDYADIAIGDGWAFASVEDTEPGTAVAAALTDLALESAPETDTGQTGFDPDDHTVPEVNAYVAQYAGTSPGESARVLELERAGQNRKSIEYPFAPGTAGN